MSYIIWTFGAFPLMIFLPAMIVIGTFLPKEISRKKYWVILPWIVSLLSRLVVFSFVRNQEIAMNGWFWGLWSVGALFESSLILAFLKEKRRSQEHGNDGSAVGDIRSSHAVTDTVSRSVSQLKLYYEAITKATTNSELGDAVEAERWFNEADKALDLYRQGNPFACYCEIRDKAIFSRDKKMFAIAEHLFFGAERIIQSAMPKRAGDGSHCSMGAAACLFELWLAKSGLYQELEDGFGMRECCNKIIETADALTFAVLECFYEKMGKPKNAVREEVALAYKGLAVASSLDGDLQTALSWAQKAYDTCSDDHRISRTLQLLQEEVERQEREKQKESNDIIEIPPSNFPEAAGGDMRVFVSSTFRGLVEERNELALKTFPRLREMCEKRSLIWTAVDLRWGITDDDMNQGEVVPICLDQIERCPYFIGIVGERYGTPLEALPVSNLSRPEHRWVDEHPAYSITAIEMIHAALSRPPRAQAAFFYIKSGEMPVEQKTDHSGHENVLADPVDLETLKNAIIRSGHSVRFYRTPDNLAELVWDDLSAVVETLAPDVSDEFGGVSRMSRQSRWLVGKANELNTSGLLLERSSVSSPIREMLLGSSGGVILVSGAVASGKTQVLLETALWAQETLSDAVVVPFFPSSGAFGRDPEVASILLAEGAAQYGINEKVPVSMVAQIDFSKWLSIFSKKGKTVIVVDCAGDADSVLSWIPEGVPPNVLIVLSALETEGKEYTAAVRIDLAPLSEEERRIYSVEYLRTHGKKLTEEQLAHLARTPACGLPGYLRTLIDELCIYGEYERFNNYFNDCLNCSDLSQLYHKVLDRVHHSFPASEDVKAVDSALRLVEASGQGLAETELLDLLGGRDQLFPQGRWQPMALNMRSFIDDSTGLLRMRDQFASEIARSLSANGAPAILYPYNILIGYFSGRPPSKRRSEMLCHLLRQTESWETLYNVLSGCPDGEHESRGGIKDVTVFTDAYLADSAELERCWLAISKNLGKTPRDGYRWIMVDPSKHDHKALLAVAQMLRCFGFQREATRLTAQMPVESEDLNPFEQLQLVDDKVKGLLTAGRVQEALDVCSKEISDAESRGYSRGVADYLLLRATTFMQVQRAQEAMADLKKYEAIKSKEEDGLGLMTAYFNLAHCCNMLFRNDEAIRYLDEYEAIGKKTKNAELDLEAKYIRAISLHGKQDYAECLRVCDQYIEHAEKYCSEERLINILGVKGVCLRAMGNPAEGLRWMKRQEAICRKINDASSLASCLNNLANTLAALGKYDEATACFEEELSIAESTGNPVRIVQNLIYQSRMFVLGGFQSEAAERLFKAHSKANQLGVKIRDVVHADILGQLSELASRVGLKF